jgi:DNA-directed RNA polymerase subunit RPC12/RpoP
MKLQREKIKMVGQKSVQSIAAEGATSCPDCGSKDLVKKADEIYCKKCGYVLD